MNRPALLSLSFVAGAACGADSDSNHVQLDDLAVGQRGEYRMLTGEMYPSPSQSPFSYVDARLTVEIVGEDALGFLVEETFEAASSVPADRVDGLEPGTVYRYHLRPTGGAVEVEVDTTSTVRPRLFPHLRGTTLALADVTSPETALFGWKTTLPYCECATDAFVTGAEINGVEYPRLNVRVENELMQLDGPGVTYIYAADAGLVRTTVYSWWNGEGHGFDRD